MSKETTVVSGRADRNARLDTPVLKPVSAIAAMCRFSRSSLSKNVCSTHDDEPSGKLFGRCGTRRLMKRMKMALTPRCSASNPYGEGDRACASRRGRRCRRLPRKLFEQGRSQPRPRLFREPARHPPGVLPEHGLLEKSHDGGTHAIGSAAPRRQTQPHASLDDAPGV